VSGAAGGCCRQHGEGPRQRPLALLLALTPGLPGSSRGCIPRPRRPQPPAPTHPHPAAPPLRRAATTPAPTTPSPPRQWRPSGA
jgi:hypothetical protein